MLSFFSFAFWLSVCLWRNVCLDLLPTFFFLLFLAAPWGMPDLSSPARNGTLPLVLGAWSFNPVDHQRSPCPFTDWVVYSFDTEQHELSGYFGDESFISCIVFKYFLPFCGLFIHCVYSSVCCAKFFIKFEVFFFFFCISQVGVYNLNSLIRDWTGESEAWI